jgi:hypothetical protein
MNIKKKHSKRVLFLFYNKNVCIFGTYNNKIEIKYMSIFRNNNTINKVTYNGIGFTGLLTIAFIVLRLCNVINWSWWWVLAPVWMPLSLSILLVIIVFGLYVWMG